MKIMYLCLLLFLCVSMSVIYFYPKEDKVNVITRELEFDKPTGLKDVDSEIELFECNTITDECKEVLS